MKRRTKQQKLRTIEGTELRAEIAHTQTVMDSIQNHFEQVTDPTLIDCYIYELTAAQLRYQFLLRRFKNLEDRDYEYLV